MTDMRATERLLEVIDEECVNLCNARHDLDETGIGQSTTIAAMLKRLEKAEHAISAAQEELRRRGDTLVRRDDLRTAANFMRQFVEERYGTNPAELRDPYRETAIAYHETIERLENAIGGKP